MKKTLLFLFMLSFLVNCSSQSSKFTGVWLNKDDIGDGILIIEQSKNNVVVHTNDQSYAGIVNDNTLQINVSGFSMTGLLDDSGKLIINGKSASKVANSIEDYLKPKEIGGMTLSTAKINIPIKSANQAIVLDNGRHLYNFIAAKRIDKAISGWRLPSYDEWKILEKNGKYNEEELMNILGVERSNRTSTKQYYIGGFWQNEIYSNNERGSVMIMNNGNRIEAQEIKAFNNYLSLVLVKE